MRSGRAFAVLAGLGMLTVAVSPAVALPTPDGRFDPAEGYTSTFGLTLSVENVAKPVPGGVMHTAVDPLTDDVFVHVALPTSLVDNTYGANAIGWGSEAPSGKNHNYKDLKGSDDGEFVICDGAGNIVLRFTLDYHEGNSPKAIAIDFGPAGSVIGSTSLDYNWLTLGYKLDKNSPAASPQLDTFGNIDYSKPYILEDSTKAGWIFEVAYEFKIAGSVFGGHGFGGLGCGEDQTLFHVSPNKLGKNKVVTPEPATMALLGVGAVGMLARRKRRRVR